jgi:hypothetical protein
MPKTYEELASSHKPVDAMELALAEIRHLIDRGELDNLDDALARHGLDFSPTIAGLFWKKTNLAARDHYFNRHVFMVPPGSPASKVFRMRETINYFADQGDVASMQMFLALATRDVGGVPIEVLDSALLHAATVGNVEAVELLVPRVKDRLFPSPSNPANSDLGDRVLLAAAKIPDRLPRIARAVLRQAPDHAFISERALEPVFRAKVDSALQIMFPRPEDMDSSAAAIRLKQAFVAAAAAQRLDLLAQIPAPYLHDHDIIFALSRVVETSVGQEPQAIRMFDLLTQKRPELNPKLCAHLGAAILTGSTELARHLQNRGVPMPTGGRYTFPQRLWQSDANVIKASNEFQDLRASWKTAWNQFMFDKVHTGWTKEKGALLIDAVGKHSPILREAKFIRRAVEHHPAAVNVLLDAGVEFPLASAIKLLDADEDRAAQRVIEQHIVREGFIANEPLWPKLRLKDGTKQSQARLLTILSDRGVNLSTEDIKTFLCNPLTPSVNSKLLEMPGAEHLDQSKLPDGILKGVETYRAWFKKFKEPPPAGLENCSPHGFRFKTYATVRNWLQQEQDMPAGSPRATILNQRAYNLTCLFTTEDRVRQYLERHGKASRSPLSDLAKFHLPPNGKWPVKPWADFVLKFGPTATKYLQFADRVPPAGSLRRLREEVAAFSYPNAHINPRLAALCTELDVKPERFQRAMEVISAIDPKLAAVNIPNLTIDGKEFGRPGFTWRRAAPNDPRILFAGDLTGCCQKIGGLGEASAVHSASSANGGCFFLTKNTHGLENVVAVAWAWRGPRGELCLDSFEPSSPAHAACLPEILKSMATKLEADHPDVTHFSVGCSGRTPILAYPTRAGADAAAPINYELNRDSSRQYVIFSHELYEAERAAQALVEASQPRQQVEMALGTNLL